ncbi:SAM-dependent methyltransferase, partial [Plantactinospora siamensis]
MRQPDEPPVEIDLSRPSAARVYDYFLGGAHNFEIDRQLAEQISRMTPNLADTMRAGRAFLRRAVRVLVDSGIDQFLDIGSGIPTVGNVHEVAQAVNPAARVVYVDIDPVAV